MRSGASFCRSLPRIPPGSLHSGHFDTLFLGFAGTASQAMKSGAGNRLEPPELSEHSFPGPLRVPGSNDGLNFLSQPNNFMPRVLCFSRHPTLNQPSANPEPTLKLP